MNKSNKPIVAIVGRPNVGKSTLFNRLAGNRISIIEGKPNITRDRVYADAKWSGKSFIIVDTGGLEPAEADIIKSKIKYQVEIALDEAELIIFLVDGRSGITSTDKEIAELLRKTNKNILLVINKVEDFSRAEEIKWEFYALGFDEPMLISAEHGKNTGNLLDKITGFLPDDLSQFSENKEAINVAIIGKPNVGKSSLVNYIVGQERVIVSQIPGTTRDAIDTLITKENITFNLIDTAGLRRKSRVKDPVEYYSVLRTIKAVDRSDSVLMLIDALEGISNQDKKIVGYAHDAGKAIVIGVNKWDLVERNEKIMEEYQEAIYRELKFLRYAPVTFISAKTGERVNEILEIIEYVVEQNSRRIKTGELNEVLEEAVQLREPPADHGKRLKIYYATQGSVKPPTFILFVNSPGLIHFSYLRYLENSLRKAFGFTGTPLKFNLRKRS